MTHRCYRLAIHPELAPEPQVVFDFDGRTSLERVQQTLRRAFDLDSKDPRYAFLLPEARSGKQARYVDPKMVGLRADKALLFRLQLRIGDRFTYVSHFGEDRRYAITVLSISERPEASSEPQRVSEPAPTRSTEPPLVDLAHAVAARALQLRVLRLRADADSRADERRLLDELGSLALELGQALRQDLPGLIELERVSGSPTLTLDLLSLPLELARASPSELALRVAQAFEFVAPDEIRGDIALIHALAGERDQALSAIAENLARARHRYVAEAKAGDAYRALGELDAAEVYYRRSLAETQSSTERSEATVRLTSFLLDIGRDADAAALAAAHASSSLEPVP